MKQRMLFMYSFKNVIVTLTIALFINVDAGILKSIFRPSNSRADFPSQEKFIILTQPPGQLTSPALATTAVSTCPAKVSQPVNQPAAATPQQQATQQTATVAVQAPPANTLTYIPASAIQYPQIPIASFAAAPAAVSAIPFSTVLTNPSTLQQLFSSSPIFSALGDRIEKSNQLLTQLESLMGSESMVKSASTDPSLNVQLITTTHNGNPNSPQATLMRRLQHQQSNNLPPTLPNQLTTHHYNSRNPFIPPNRMERRGGDMAMPIGLEGNPIAFSPHLVNSQTNHHLADL